MTGRLGYYLSYRLGLAFWDTFDTDPALADLIESLPPGRALDLGCGTGRNSIYLARHGWDVTGVDLVEATVTQARRQAAADNVQARFVHGDITRLNELGVGDDHTLLIDFGCFHSVPVAKRDAYAAAVTEAAAPNATLWMWGLGIKPRFGLSLTADELRTRFPAWHLDTADPVSGQELRAITRNMPLIQRPTRAVMTKRWFPHAYRSRLTRRRQ
jgi:SAM-dependent methyltransferase